MKYKLYNYDFVNKKLLIELYNEFSFPKVYKISYILWK